MGKVDRTALEYGRGGGRLQGDLRGDQDLEDHPDIGSCSKDLLLKSREQGRCLPPGYL